MDVIDFKITDMKDDELKKDAEKWKARVIQMNKENEALRKELEQYHKGDTINVAEEDENKMEVCLVVVAVLLCVFVIALIIPDKQEFMLVVITSAFGALMLSILFFHREMKKY